MSTPELINGQDTVASGVQKFVDNLAVTIAQTMSVAAEKVAVEAAVVRQKYRFEAMQSVLHLIHGQRDQLMQQRDSAGDATTKAIIDHQLILIQDQLQGILLSSGVPAAVAKEAARQAVAPPSLPAPALASKRRRVLRAS